MRLEMKDVVNKHKGSPCICVLHGPSLNAILPKLRTYKEKGFVLISCNEWWDYVNFPIQYSVCASNTNTVRTLNSKINDHPDTTLLYSDVIDNTERGWVDANLKCNYLPYDNRHVNNHACSVGGMCCGSTTPGNFLVPGRLTLQEELAKLCNHNQIYGAGDTVALHVVAFAVLFGCNPVYVAGMDLDYNLGYAINARGLTPPSADSLNQYRDRILESLDIINNCAKNLGTEIININPKSIYQTLKIGSIDESL